MQREQKLQTALKKLCYSYMKQEMSCFCLWKTKIGIQNVCREKKSKIGVTLKFRCPIVHLKMLYYSYTMQEMSCSCFVSEKQK